jgi:hypothetical protein
MCRSASSRVLNAPDLIPRTLVLKSCASSNFLESVLVDAGIGRQFCTYLGRFEDRGMRLHYGVNLFDFTRNFLRRCSIRSFMPPEKLVRKSFIINNFRSSMTSSEREKHMQNSACG